MGSLPVNHGGPRCSNNNCYEAELTADGQVKVWSSRYPENGAVVFDRDEFDRHIADVKAGKLNHLFSGTTVAV